ncbi:MAG: indolepyruvate oxidoreductase subunit beta [Firmicutes bacterium]|nr:indolepyruvate oxidoreductase subunit beta [Bacillota bacterium]
MKKFDFILAGVGGQGTILASNILAEVGLELGYEVKKSEILGMAQRGGTVESHVRWGEKVYSPLVEEGEVDFLLGFEMLEAGRWSSFLKEESKVIINRYQIPPPAVNLGKAKYPKEKEIESLLKATAGEVIWVDALKTAQDLGNPAVAGVVLLGVLSTQVGGSTEIWQKVVERLVPVKFQELNRKAFQMGRQVTTTEKI